MDNNEEKLNIYGKMAREVAKRVDKDLQFGLTLDPKEAVKDANYIITTIRVGEDEMRVKDERIALSHHLLGQETTGAAGFSFAMRSIPALVKYMELIKEYGRADVKVFNFTNPAGVVSQTLRDMKFFDKELAMHVGCILNEYLYYFYYREEAIEHILEAKVTRGEVIKDINIHMTEELKKMDVEGDFDHCLKVFEKWYDKREGAYMANETGIKSQKPPFKFDIYEKDSGGYAGVALKYIEAELSGEPEEMILCVPNKGAIEGLEDSDVVEISCTITRDGYTPHKIDEPDELPMELIRRVKSYERLASKAIRSHSRQDAIDCLMVHPLVNSYSLAKTLIDQYISNNAEYIKGWN